MTFKFEKRAHPRIAFDVEATVEVLNRRTLAARQASVRVVNVSGAGLALTLDAEVSMGDLVRLTTRPSGEHGTLVLDAQVVWIRRNAMRLLGAFSAGLQFRPAGQDGAARLVRAAFAPRGPVGGESIRPAPSPTGQ